MPPRPRHRHYAGPVVSQQVVADYLNRSLDDWDWVKGLSRIALTKELNGFQFSHAYQPFLHQLQGFVLGMDLPQFLFFQDMGAGKTALMLALYRWHRQYNGVARLLVMVPKEVH